MVASLVAAGALVVSAPGAATAASGDLMVSGRQYGDPLRGCYRGDYVPLAVGNNTDAAVLVFDDENCRGQLLGVLNPGESGVFEFGNSVFVTR
ncbi:hypothetical protein ACZ90_40150 [Streptomyces albus subsp. albus]|nr:hypothetical protein ACZ90_40150 [Streptomyces albus subsp. albus]